MGSHQQADIMDTVAILQPLFQLIEKPELREQVEDTARIYFNGDNGVTVNLIPALIVGLLLLLGLLKLLGLPILASFGLDGGDDGYGTSGGSGYGQAYARGDNYFDQTVADLQQQINQLIDSNEALTNQIYYNVGGSSPSSALSSNLLSSS